MRVKFMRQVGNAAPVVFTWPDVTVWNIGQDYIPMCDIKLYVDGKLIGDFPYRSNKTAFEQNAVLEDYCLGLVRKKKLEAV